MSDNAVVDDTDERWWRDVRHYAYVNRPFAEVCRVLSDFPARIVGGGAETDSPDEPRVELHVRRAGVELCRDVRVTLGAFEQGQDAAELQFRWEDADRPDLFPVLEARLKLHLLRTGRQHITQLGLTGRYRPPLKRVGAMADALAGSRVVLESVSRFLDDVVTRLEEEIDPRSAETASDTGRADGRERFRKVFLTVDGLDRRPGGAVALQEELRVEPGVVRAQVDVTAGLAAIQYDAAICAMDRLLTLVEAPGEAPSRQKQP